jgi:glutamine amidotransferase
MHNGFIARFRETLMRRLRDALRDEYYLSIRGSSDSEHLFGLFLNCLHDIQGEPGAVARALRRMLDVLVDWSAGGDVELQLNCAVTDGRSLVACRFSNRTHAPSLYVTGEEPYFPGGVLVASEPLLLNAHWRALEKNHIVEIDGARAIVETALAA